jgi:hypothetical protein
MAITKDYRHPRPNSTESRRPRSTILQPQLEQYTTDLTGHDLGMQYCTAPFSSASSILESRRPVARTMSSRGNVSLVHSRAGSYASDGNPTKLDSAPIPMQLHMGAPRFPSRLEDRIKRAKLSNPDLCNLAPGGSAHSDGIFESITCHEPQPRKRKREAWRHW